MPAPNPNPNPKPNANRNRNRNRNPNPNPRRVPVRAGLVRAHLRERDHLPKRLQRPRPVRAATRRPTRRAARHRPPRRARPSCRGGKCRDRSSRRGRWCPCPCCGRGCGGGGVLLHAGLDGGGGLQRARPRVPPRLLGPRHVPQRDVRVRARLARPALRHLGQPLPRGQAAAAAGVARAAAGAALPQQLLRSRHLHARVEP